MWWLAVCAMVWMVVTPGVRLVAGDVVNVEACDLFAEHELLGLDPAMFWVEPVDPWCADASFWWRPTGHDYLAEPDTRIRSYVDATTRVLDKRVQATVPKLDGLPRQLLALKYYLARSRRELRAKWVWSPSQAARFRKTTEFQTIAAEVEKVRAKFAELNPGYDLKVRVEIRTLAEQIANWNGTPSVAAAADGLIRACRVSLADTAFTDVPSPTAITRFRQLLLRQRVSVVPTVAVPGLSQHGQLRAFDFVVVSGDRVIAGTETSGMRGAWDKPGWTAKLKEAVKQSGARFEGPLAVPREPWHYSYKP